MLGLFKAAPHKERIPEERIDEEYKKLRFQVFMGIFLGYAGYYLIRKNFTLAIPYLTEEGFSKGNWGRTFRYIHCLWNQ